MKLFLDDVRPIPEGDEWIIARGIHDFQIQIKTNGSGINLISFDHDLGEGPNGLLPDGLDCAKWLIDWLQDGGEMPQLQEISVHSMNPVGIVNIIQLFDSARRAGILSKNISLYRI